MAYSVRIKTLSGFQTRYGFGYPVVVEGPEGPSHVDPTHIIVYGFTVVLYRMDSKELNNLLLIAGEVFDLIYSKSIKPWDVDTYVRNELERRRRTKC